MSFNPTGKNDSNNEQVEIDPTTGHPLGEVILFYDENNEPVYGVPETNEGDGVDGQTPAFGFDPKNDDPREDRHTDRRR